jgi:UDP-N-acetylmuramate: L-alanyl-gamma-D-glutamyl-meso-diaminopimelate ligase
MCVYNKDDKQVRELANKYLRKEFHFSYPYTIVHNPIGQIGVKGTRQKIYKTRDGVTEIKLDGMKLTTRLLGKHNVSNIAAAWQVCELLAVTKEEFAQHLASFEGAALRMERVHESPKLVVVRDFAHAPSKVQASVDAMAEAYKGHDLTAVLELHTYSSLNANFIGQYQGALKKAKHKIVLVDKHALELKKMPPLSEDDVKRAFGDKSIVFVETLAQLQQALANRASGPQAILLMSSGRLAGLELNSLWT